MPFIGVQPASALLSSADIQDGQITTAKIADDAVTGSKIENSPTIANGLTLTDGDITLASGHGIDFSATANSSGTMHNELLNNYEAGLFTPTLTPGSGSINLSHANGLYNRIGDVVHAQINMFTTSVSSLGGALTVGGLPFTSATENQYGGSTSYNGRTAGSMYVDLQASGASGEFMFLLFPNGTTGGIYLGEDTSNQSLATYIDGSSYIVIGVTYIAQ